MQKFLFVILLSLTIATKILGQSTIQIEGYVTDAVTNLPIPNVTVALRGTTIGTITADNGFYAIKANSDSLILSVSYVGYEAQYFPLKLGRNRIDVSLQPAFFDLDEIEVRPKREKYVRRGNPAVDFVEQVIARRNLHNPQERDFFSYHSYEQRIVGFDDVEVEKMRKNRAFKNYDFIFDYVDSTSVKNRTILPLFNEEVIVDYYYRKSPSTECETINGLKRAGLIEFIPEDGMKQIINEAFQDVDIFQDNIMLCLNRFVSPLSTIGPLYYKYYLLDTVIVDNVMCMDLGFAPFNPESFGFVGHLYVTLDSTYFVKKAELNTPRHINLNLIGEMIINQEYIRTDDSIRILTKNDIAMIFQFYKNTKTSYARRIALYSNHSFERLDDKVFERKAPVLELEDARRRTDDYWNEARKDADVLQKNSVDKMMKQLREKPFYYWSEKTIDILINGYVQTSETDSKFEFGPVNTFISGNALEGFRLRAGGTTRVNLSRQLFFDGYMAYGFGDHKVKGDAIFEYSFNKKREYRKEYPFHYLRAEYRYDINQIGQHYLYTNADNIFLMWKRSENKLLTYIQQAELSYYREHYNGLGYSIKLRHLTEWATPDVPFSVIQRDGTDKPADYYTSAQMVFFLRWAPDEKFFQSRNNRYAITLDAPIITLTHTIARKGIMGSDQNYQRTELGIRKRFWLSPFGYLDFYGQAGKVWDRASYPLLLIPNANLSYTLETETFSLMNPMEFINDRFVAWESTYQLNGWLFNRLPLIKKLKLREIVSFRGWYGDLSEKNNPLLNGAGLYRFPENTYMMGDKPYMEMGVGIANILKLIRLDYIWRLSYRDHERTPNRGIRMKIIFGF